VPTAFRQERLRDQRSAFLLFLGAVFVSLMAALPLLTLSLARDGVAAPQALRPLSFAGLDRNHDGFVDSSETAGLAALSGIFAAADGNGDGRLDRREFARAHAALERRP